MESIVLSSQATMALSTSTRLGSTSSAFYMGSNSISSVVAISKKSALETSRRGGVLKVEAKGRKTPVPGMVPRQQMRAPQIDPNDDNPKFVIFIRNAQINLWYPLSIVDGGTAAKMIVNIMKYDLGKKIYEGVLTRNIAEAIYKDEKGLRRAAVKQYTDLSGVPAFQYGYKILDPKNPKAGVSSSNVVLIPPKEELKTVLQKAKEFIDEKILSLKGSP